MLVPSVPSVGFVLRHDISGVSVILPFAFWSLQCQEWTLRSSQDLAIIAGVGEFLSVLSCHSFLLLPAGGFLFHSNVLTQPIHDLSLLWSV